MFIFEITEIRRSIKGQVIEDITFNDLTLLSDIQKGKKLGGGSFGDVYLALWKVSFIYVPIHTLH